MLRITRRCLTWAVGIGFFLCLGLVCAHQLFPLPLPNTQADLARVVTDKHGVPLRTFADKKGVWRYPARIEEVSPLYLQALIQYEDRWFYQHPGVNPLAMLRALGQWVYYGKAVSGGSTITMQVARLLDPNSRSVRGKLWQMLRALQLEWQLSKREILALYLNYAPFGGPIEGVQAASFTYFGKPALTLTHAEAALLAVLPQSPSRLRPDRHPQLARAARDKVLARLAKFKVWPAATVQEAYAEAVVAQYNSHPKIAPLLARRLVQARPHQQHINTTLDIHLQRNIERAVKDYIQAFPAQTSAAVLILDNRELSALAYVGSADFNNKRFGHVDMVSAIRSPGSTLKPFLYAVAMDRGLIHEQSLLLDVPSEFDQYQPQNFHQGFSGPVSVRNALQRSLNVPAVQVLDAVGVNTFYAHLRSAGMRLQTPGNSAVNLSLILGGVGVSLESLTRAFSAFGRAGLVRPIRYALDQPAQQDRRMLSPEAAWITADIMAGASLSRFQAARSIANQRMTLPFKTGTSYGFRDAWVLAASRDVTVGIWVGRPDGTPLSNNFGRQNALPLLRRVLKHLPSQALSLNKKPQSVTRNKICWPLGTLKILQEPHWCMREKNAWLIDQQAPANSLADPLDTDWTGNLIFAQLDAAGEQTNGQCEHAVHRHKTFAVWPSSLELWLPQKWRRKKVLPPFSIKCRNTVALQKLKIHGIASGSVLAPRPGTHSLPKITASVSGFNDPPHWFFNGKWQGQGEELELAEFVPGAHHVSVIDGAGNMDEVRFTVVD